MSRFHLATEGKSQYLGPKTDPKQGNSGLVGTSQQLTLRAYMVRYISPIDRPIGA